MERNQKEILRILKKNSKVSFIGIISIAIACIIIAVSIVINYGMKPESVTPDQLLGPNQYVKFKTEVMPVCFADYSDGNTVVSNYLLTIYNNEKLVVLQDSARKEDRFYNQEVDGTAISSDGSTLFEIEGMSESIPSDLENILIECVNEEIFGDNVLNRANMNEYVAAYMINLERSPSNSAVAGYYIGGAILLFGIIMCIVRVANYYSNVKYVENLSRTIDLDDLLNQIKNPLVVYNSCRLCFTNNYVIGYGKTFEILRKENLIWTYIDHTDERGNFAKRIMIKTVDGRMHEVANFAQDKTGEIDNAFKTLCEYKPNMLIGYTNENVLATRYDKIQETANNLNTI